MVKARVGSSSHTTAKTYQAVFGSAGGVALPVQRWLFSVGRDLRASRRLARDVCVGGITSYFLRNSVNPV